MITPVACARAMIDNADDILLRLFMRTFSFLQGAGIALIHQTRLC